MRATDVARVFGVSAQAVGLWHSRDGCPRGEDGRYDLRAVVAWRVDRAREESEIAPAADGKYTPDQMRIFKARADMAEDERDHKRGELVKRAEMIERETQIATVFKHRLLSRSRVLAPKLYGKEVAEIKGMIRKSDESILRGLADEAAGR